MVRRSSTQKKTEKKFCTRQSIYLRRTAQHITGQLAEPPSTGLAAQLKIKE
jgi:hypothetical protein